MVLITISVCTCYKSVEIFLFLESAWLITVFLAVCPFHWVYLFCLYITVMVFSSFISVKSVVMCPLSLLILLFFFGLFRAASAASGSSQAREPTGSSAASLCDSSLGSKPHLKATPQLQAALDPSPTEQGQGSNLYPHGYKVEFVSAEPQQELLIYFLLSSIFCQSS